MLVALSSPGIVSPQYAGPGPSVVLLLSPEVLDHKPGYAGTGFVTTTESGRVVTVTNTHVCDGAQKGILVVDWDRPHWGMLHILAYDTVNDLCLLEGAPDTSPPLKLAESFKEGEAVVTIGHPKAGPLTTSIGVIGKAGPVVTQSDEKLCSGPEKKLEIKKQKDGSLSFTCYCVNQGVETTAQVFPGSSGSPVLNLKGEVVGVVFAGDDVTHEGEFIPVDKLRALISRF